MTTAASKRLDRLEGECNVDRRPCPLCEAREAHEAERSTDDLVVVDSYKQPTNCPRCGREFTILVQFVERRDQYEAAR